MAAVPTIRTLWSRRRARGPRGYAILVLLIVIVVILILTLKGPLSTDPQTQVTQAQTYIERSAEAACAINRQTVYTQVINWQTLHPGETPSPNVLSDLVGGTTCPRGGVFYMGKDGTIYCTEHKPPPDNELKALIVLNPPTPESTPAATPAGAAR